MLENIKRIRAIDYTDITKIPNYVEKVTLRTLEILKVPGFFGRDQKLETIIEKAMDDVAYRTFSDQKIDKYEEDKLKEAKEIAEEMKKYLDYIEA